MEENMRQIVVGVDGSPNAREALRFATGQARLDGSELTLVHAWQGPVIWVDPYSVNATVEELGDQARRETRQAADDVERELGRPVRCIVECCGPAELLLRQGEGADLLVVGARGRDGVVGLVLGSVANQVVHHPPCPVVVVPSAPDLRVDLRQRSAATSDV